MGDGVWLKYAVYALLTSVFVAGPVWAAGVGGASAARAKVADPKSRVSSFKGNAQWGREKVDSERCQECHGLDGNGAGHSNGPEGKFAKLAGQLPAYVVKQIQDFRSGARRHDQMAIMARSVSDEDVADIAAYFASLPVMKGEAGGDHARAEALFAQGDATRGIVACASCHGAQGKGPTSSAWTPVIGGQEWRYLEKQLLDWRSGDRRNSPDGVMTQVMAPLTDKEIQALADYLSSR